MMMFSCVVVKMNGLQMSEGNVKNAEKRMRLEHVLGTETMERGTTR